MAYYTNVGPVSGPVRNRHGFIAIGVFPAGEIRTPIGMAVAAGQDQDGLTLWRLTIDTFDMPGVWVVIDREFRPMR